jgi:hypothetical protein
MPFTASRRPHKRRTFAREDKALTARTVPHSALAVTIDTGDANDIHPKASHATVLVSAFILSCRAEGIRQNTGDEGRNLCATFLVE